MRASRGLKWENKMYKLKRSIDSPVATVDCTFKLAAEKNG